MILLSYCKFRPFLTSDYRSITRLGNYPNMALDDVCDIVPKALRGADVSTEDLTLSLKRRRRGGVVSKKHGRKGSQVSSLE